MDDYLFLRFVGLSLNDYFRTAVTVVVSFLITVVSVRSGTERPDGTLKLIIGKWLGPRRRWLRDQSRSRLQQEGSATVAHHSSLLPRELDPHDPNFERKSRSWAFEAQCQMNELVLRTRETVEESRALVAEVDRLLARK